MGIRAIIGARLASVVIAGLWMGLSVPAHAGTICAGSGCATSASVTGESARETSVSKPVTLNRYAKRTAKKKSALRTRVAAKRNVRVSKAAQYARVAARVKKAGKKFVAAAKPVSSEPAPLKPSLANARAEMTADADVRVAGAADDSPIAVETKAPEANIQLVAADQVNEIDRAAENEAKPPQPTVKPVPVPLDARGAVASSDSTWDQTSLIGKLFVAFGGLLTLASAARLFIA